MTPNARTLQLNEALAKYSADKDEQALKAVLHDAFMEGYLVTIFYSMGSTQQIGPGVAEVTKATRIGDPVYIHAERPALSDAYEALKALTPEERAHIQSKTDECRQHIVKAISAISGIHLFAGMEEPAKELMSPLNEAISKVKAILTDVERADPS